MYYNSNEMGTTVKVYTPQRVGAPIIKAKHPSKCSLTGRQISVGDTIVYHPKDEYGPAYTELLIKVYMPTPGNKGWLFNVLKDCFEQWINEENRTEEREYYFGSFEEMDGGSYGNYKGAIEQAIDNLIEEMNEYNIQWCYLNVHDLAAAFQI